MNLDEFQKKRDEFLAYIRVERNLADNTQRAYAGDLNQFVEFWEQLSTQEKKLLSLRQVIERFLVNLFYKKIDKSSIARKFSCFTSFEKYLRTQGIELALQLTRPRLDKKAKAQTIIEAFSHLGKPYDYEFDFATDHALVCTEVIWRCYRPAQNKKGLNFKLLDIAGRKTLPANEIARLFAKEHGRDDRQLDFVYFLDASEKAMKAFVSTEEAFQTSHTRFKWDLALD